MLPFLGKACYKVKLAAYLIKRGMVPASVITLI
jgi:hypothetical protein